MAIAARLFMATTINTEIAARLKEIARLLDERGANQFRIRAYRRAAETLENLRRPAVSELLDVDHEYREKAEAGRLRKIAPKRFNPTGRAWLPVMHTKRGKRRYTALFSNTALAHELGKTHDWVVLYYDGEEGEKQCTVVTAKKGPLAGSGVVRGRETESAAFYNSQRGGG